MNRKEQKNKMTMMKLVKLFGKITFVLLIIVYFVVGDKVGALADENKEYTIKINTAQNCITIYEKGADGQTLVPFKAMACSAYDRQNAETAIFSVKSSQAWKKTVDNKYVQYVAVIDGDFDISTVPYEKQSSDSLSTANYNRLGEEKTSGGIWLCAADAQWIYENCPAGTSVEVYADESTAGPLGKPDTMKLPDTSKFVNWDPTDSNPENPWKNSSARLEGVKNIEVNAGESCDLLKGVQAYDTCGNTITNNIIILGNYDLNKEGTYILTYYIKDYIGSEATADAKLHVKEGKANNIEETTESVQSQGNATNKEKSGNSSGQVKKIFGIGIFITILSLFLIKCLKKD